MPTPAKRPVTTRDIAEKSGVHQSTVSRALRNDPRIRPEVREKVQACAKELGYRPNPMVSAFTAHVRSHRRSPAGSVVAFLDCHSKEHPYQSAYLNGAKARALELGFHPEIFQLHKVDFNQQRLNKILTARGINGLLVLPVPLDFDLSEFQFDSLAVSTVDPSLHRPALHRAQTDYFQGMQLALDTLSARGYKRIAFCTSPYELQLLDALWMGGFLAWQSLHPVSRQVPAYVAKTWEPEPFHVWRSKHKPDAIVTNCEIFFRWCEAAGHPSPETGFALLSAGPEYPGLAGISQNMDKVGAAAVDMILAQMHRNEYGLAEFPKKLLIQSSWVDGASVHPRANG